MKSWDAVVRKLQQDKRELKREVQSQKRRWKPGQGWIAGALRSMTPKAFAKEVDGEEMELFDKLFPIIWPVHLLWTQRHLIGGRRKAVADLIEEITMMGNGESWHPDEVRDHVERLEYLRDLLSEAIDRVRESMRPPP